MGDWSDPIYITSQVLVILAFIGFGASYLLKGRSAILMVAIAANTLIGISYVLLFAWVGVAMCVISIIRDFASYFINKNRSEEDKNKITKTDWYLLALWSTLLIGVTIPTADGFLSLFALFGTLAFTLSIWQKNILIYKYLGLLSAFCWTIYNAATGTFFGLVLEAFLIIATIVGIIMYYKKQKNTPAV